MAKVIFLFALALLCATVLAEYSVDQEFEAAIPDVLLAEDEAGGNSQPLAESINELASCSTSSCQKARRECTSIAKKRTTIRLRITKARTSLRGCTGRSKCVSLRRQIRRLTKKYRQFGGRLRWYLKMAKRIVYGPKRHTLKVPKEFLAAGYKAAGATLADAVAKSARWTPSLSQPKSSGGRASRAFSDSRNRKLRIPVRKVKFSKKPVWRKAFPLHKHKKIMKQPSWWRKFVVRATRPTSNERRTISKFSPKMIRRPAKSAKKMFRPQPPRRARSLRTARLLHKRAPKKATKPEWYSEEMVNKLFGPRFVIRNGRRVIYRPKKVRKPKAKKPKHPKWLRKLLAEKRRKEKARRQAKRQRRERERRLKHHTRWDRWGKRYGPSE